MEVPDRPPQSKPTKAKCEHLHEVFVNDAPDIGWVNTISAISISFSSAVTLGPVDGVEGNVSVQRYQLGVMDHC